VKRAAIIVAAAIGGLLIGARRSSGNMRPVPFQRDDSPGDRIAKDYEREATLDRLVDLYDGDTQRASVVHWRIDQLLRAGFDDLRASTIAATDADWRQAIELVRSGCPHHTAADIVLN
jgi:hypothetical protein